MQIMVTRVVEFFFVLFFFSVFSLRLLAPMNVPSIAVTINHAQPIH